MNMNMSTQVSSHQLRKIMMTAKQFYFLNLTLQNSWSLLSKYRGSTLNKSEHYVPTLGELHLHRDGGVYQVTNIVQSAVDKSICVTYDHVWPFEQKTWIRPLAEWTPARFLPLSAQEAECIYQSESRETARYIISGRRSLRSAIEATPTTAQDEKVAAKDVVSKLLALMADAERLGVSFSLTLNTKEETVISSTTEGVENPTAEQGDVEHITEMWLIPKHWFNTNSEEVTPSARELILMEALGFIRDDAVLLHPTAELQALRKNELFNAPIRMGTLNLYLSHCGQSPIDLPMRVEFPPGI